MTKNENELLNIIRQHSKPEQAIEIAVKTIIEFLEQHGSYQEPSAVFLQEQV